MCAKTGSTPRSLVESLVCTDPLARADADVADEVEDIELEQLIEC